jgi:Flp pilus assembly protein TadG
MSCVSFVRHISRAASRFASANEGNIAVIFAIAVLPVLGLVGAAIDYSHATKVRTSMQAALDSTALMLSKDLTQGLITSSEINTKAQAYFAGLFAGKAAKSVSINAIYTPGTSSTVETIQINGSGSITTDFMRMVGFPNMSFTGTSTATWDTSKLGSNSGDNLHGDSSGQSSQIDMRMKKLCDSAKAAGVTIYTAQNDTDGAREPAVRPYCGAGSGRLVIPMQPGQTSNAFQQLHLSK